MGANSKTKILVFFATMVISFIIIALSSLIQFQKYERVRRRDETIEKINARALNLIKVDADFFNYEITNSEFFKTGSSNYLIHHDTLFNQMISKTILEIEISEDNSIKESLQKIDSAITSYDSTFKEIVSKIRERGFKDYGLEGKFRGFAHDLEDYKLLSQLEILTLRRHEKDYLLRHEKEYIKKFDGLVSELLKKNRNSEETIYRIENYVNSFHEFISIDEKIGLNNPGTMKDNLKFKLNEMLKLLEDLEISAEIQTNEAYKTGITIFMVSIGLGAVLCIILISKISKNS